MFHWKPEAIPIWPHPKPLSRFLLHAIASAALCALSLHAQTPAATSHRESQLQQHYDAAQDFQSKGDLEQASLQYKLFLADALGRLADHRAKVGGYAKAAPWFSEALRLDPNNTALQLDYAEAALNANDLSKAESLARQVIKTDAKNAKARLALGRVLLRMGKNAEAKQQLQAAVALDPDFEDGFALATADLAMKDEAGATKIFSEMMAGFGDTAAIHMNFGRAYGEAGYPEQAITEFKKAIAEDGKMPGAHYSLGASYLLNMGEIDFPEAIAEFKKELAIHPDDFLSHEQLGYIYLNQHKLSQAETELTRAAALNPHDPDTFVSLGQLYNEMNKPAQAEAALRKAISRTTDPARNHYQVQRAHYLLGRILVETGHTNEAEKEMQISAGLLKLSSQQNQGKLAKLSSPPIKAEQAPPDAGELEKVEAYEKQIGPAIADSFNNLGATAARDKDYIAALSYFKNAAEWNPAIDGLDYNWGKAAYAANQYGQAIQPLSRALEAHPEDVWVRSALGISEFMIKDYRSSLKTLHPIQASIGAAPLLAYVYAVSLIETGDYEGGIARLKALEQTSPQNASVHRALGVALLNQKDYAGAAKELRAGLQIDPTDEQAKYHLALALIGLNEQTQAQTLLVELSTHGSQSADVYYQLGKLQLDGGDARNAISNLQKAASLDPASGVIHKELTAAYLHQPTHSGPVGGAK